MRFFTTTAAAMLGLSASVSGLNIMIGNDDDFAAAQIRETYRLLKAAGHNVVMVAPAVQQSGQGGRSLFTNSGVLEQNTDFDIVEAGAPSVGTDPNDSMICRSDQETLPRPDTHSYRVLQRHAGGLCLRWPGLRGP